jgi:hypothetical protein
MGEVVPFLAEWETFYVIVGSSAAALTGLQFVVIALGAEAKALGGPPQMKAFGTPTVVHFCAALLVSAILTAPWHRLGSAGLALGACGVAGFVYAVIVIRRTVRQTGYKPVLEDWIWHCTLPLLAYASLLIAAIVLHWRPTTSLFVIGAAAVLLLFIGIHNAWDTVLYMTVERRPNPDRPPDQT